MGVREWIAAAALVITLLGVAVSYGRMAGEFETAQREIALLREDVRAINAHLVEYTLLHRDHGEAR